MIWRTLKSQELWNHRVHLSHRNHQMLWWNWLSGGLPQELPLLQRISSSELPASETTNYPQIRAHMNASSHTHLNINCSEETAWIRPSWSNTCNETTTVEEQQEKENCLGQKTQGMDIIPVEICFPENLILEMVWDELERRVKVKQPTSAQHL